MMYFLYNNETKEFQGSTKTPEDFPELSYTDVEPDCGEWDEFEEHIFFIDGAWEIRTI